MGLSRRPAWRRPHRVPTSLFLRASSRKAAPGGEQPGGFTGTVVDAITGRGIEGARVLVEGDSYQKKA